jgi:hypothetical protein
LKIAADLVLCFIAAGNLSIQLSSWAFILVTLLHSGLLYIFVIFEQTWAGQLLGPGIGPILILPGLLLNGITVATGFTGRIVED